MIVILSRHNKQRRLKAAVHIRRHLDVERHGVVDHASRDNILGLQVCKVVLCSWIFLLLQSPKRLSIVGFEKAQTLQHRGSLKLFDTQHHGKGLIESVREKR